ncbi:unnamed protein product [Leptidea sinapis]|uniref:Uncharacterized protein n=1 Tax=Leptidea sinapis TaxID=189913 RepID=A0A5E4PYH6_9NEOP|nr:unnamed protein product [Leptidea sinapis]
MLYLNYLKQYVWREQSKQGPRGSFTTRGYCLCIKVLTTCHTTNFSRSRQLGFPGADMGGGAVRKDSS